MIAAVPPGFSTSGRTRSNCCKLPTSRFKGVSWGKGKWKAGIQKDKQNYKLGTFEDEIDAAMAYDEKAIELYGEMARLNFPDGVDAWLEQDAAENDPETRAAA